MAGLLVEQKKEDAASSNEEREMSRRTHDEDMIVLPNYAGVEGVAIFQLVDLSDGVLFVA